MRSVPSLKTCVLLQGIITPYRAQKNFIDQLIWNVKLKLQFPVKVATVDAYQGRNCGVTLRSEILTLSILRT